MHECLLCKRDMKTATTVFGSGCIKSIYKILDIKLPKNVKDKESYLYKSIMKKLNIKNLNTNQKIWLADRFLTYQYMDRLKYGDYTELKEKLNEDIAGVKEVAEFSEFKTAKKVELKQAYTLYKKEEKFDKYISKVSSKNYLKKDAVWLLGSGLPISLTINKNTIPLEISAISAMQYALWETVIMGGRIVGYDTSADFLQHSLIAGTDDIVINDGKVVEEIKNDSQFQEKIMQIVKKHDNEEEFSVSGEDIHFDKSDLYFAIHSADLNIKGNKNNGKWNLEIELKDKFDFTKFKKLQDYIKDTESVPKSALSSLLYNLAFFSVKLKILKEYWVYIRFSINDYELET